MSACAQPEKQAGATVAAAVQPAIADAEPDVTRQVQAALDHVVAGTLGPDLLSERGRAGLPPATIADTAALLRACGAAPALELLARRTKGEERMYVYRAPCHGRPMIVEIDFGKGARINRLLVRPQ